jgi:hypothetical protein
MTGQDHNRLLSIFFLVQAGLQIFGGIIGAVVYVGMGAMFATSRRMPDGEMMGGIMVFMALVFVCIAVVSGAFYALTGWRMRKNLSGAKVMGIIASILALPGFPLGTALGIYGLWFFLGEPGKNFYDGEISSVSPPPPPNSWQ